MVGKEVDDFSFKRLSKLLHWDWRLPSLQRKSTFKLTLNYSFRDWMLLLKMRDKGIQQLYLSMRFAVLPRYCLLLWSAKTSQQTCACWCFVGPCETWRNRSHWWHALCSSWWSDTSTGTMAQGTIVWRHMPAVVYVSYVNRRYERRTIVFDGHEVSQTTKDCTHRRRTGTSIGPDVSFSGRTT